MYAYELMKSVKSSCVYVWYSRNASACPEAASAHVCPVAASTRRPMPPVAGSVATVKRPAVTGVPGASGVKPLPGLPDGGAGGGYALATASCIAANSGDPASSACHA